MTTPELPPDSQWLKVEPEQTTPSKEHVVPPNERYHVSMSLYQLTLINQCVRNVLDQGLFDAEDEKGLQALNELSHPNNNQPSPALMGWTV